MFNRRSFVTIAALAAVGSLALSACAKNNEGGGSAPKPTPTVSKAADLSSLVPASIKSAGVIKVGIDPTYAPNEYKDSSGKIVGFDVDLMDAIAAKLGLKAQYTESTFDNIIPGITGGKYDIGVSSFTDNKTREKTVDFVDYFNAGSQWGAPTSSSVNPDSACGLKVAVQTGTIQDTDDVPARSKKCTAAGKKAIVKLKYDKQDDATTAVILGKADAFVADSPVTAYGVKQSGGKLKLAGSIYDAAPYGYPMAKNSALVQAIQKALQSLMDDGTYKTICANWGNDAGEITQAKTNGALG
ncbi:ABC transporter substrate-binding protein [Jatrophihabitans telluris]|uniref:ABC transporter substrate-binding protein n=1 Tax=Jatrophihabitans telluris TaxID=2038343 RepID=A0ABY4QW77_9ACTN|nr:ABC transporter substrate-binding protein [Jatrophihabitans telluris]UQX87698.1 ABC transporter substrate-binding protein [Jatrophihabitans telluris]